ncbi:hypothetical protein AVEN_14618-1 [Araneus ventricosus]|uniref:Uncharacterized protein n=1 Tax=Araneus ventricosus TaxID=182803 RepID=A0A4Y2RIZ1_ARAVE|nr:hypothetical protein AVEN_14618-1 [Araneus ventricosus]
MIQRAIGEPLSVGACLPPNRNNRKRWVDRVSSPTMGRTISTPAGRGVNRKNLTAPAWSKTIPNHEKNWGWLRIGPTRPGGSKNLLQKINPSTKSFQIHSSCIKGHLLADHRFFKDFSSLLSQKTEGRVIQDDARARVSVMEC